ncbi:MAG: alpha-mannosidase [Thermoprotei archaeon]
MVKVFIVSHTHWDREWYQSFQEFRYRLIKVIDKAIELLKSGTFRYFLLDGQTVVLEDYLEIRPERLNELKELISKGLIGVGPWYTQPDEFLASSEALIRNLLLGHRIALSFGRITKVGYVPDSFGHIAQLPQIFRGFGIDSFFFMRGLGDEFDKLGNEFLWYAPDGSNILAVFLASSYSGGAVIGSKKGFMEEYKPRPMYITDLNSVAVFGDYTADPEVSLESAERQLKALVESWIKASNISIVLIMNGQDHFPPQGNLPNILKSLSSRLSEYEIIHGTLEGYLEYARKYVNNLKIFRGELRGAKFHRIFQNVYSTRRSIKWKNYIAQVLMEYYVEPLWTILWLLGLDYPRGFIWLAWRKILQSHAHDSIYGTVSDEVAENTLSRFEESIQIAKTLLSEGLRILGSMVDATKLKDYDKYIIVYNPLPWSRTDIVRAAVIGQDINYTVVNENGQTIPVQIIDEGINEFSVGGEKKAVISFIASDIPAMGYRVYGLKKISERPLIRTSNKLMIENEYYSIIADPEHGGSFKIFDKKTAQSYGPLNVFIDQRDAGDAYNYSPPEYGDYLAVSTYTKANVYSEEGPVFSKLVINQTLRIPRDMEHSMEFTDLPITTEVFLYKGVKRIDVKIHINNSSKDHRLRVVFQTGINCRSHFVEDHFYVLERPNKPYQGKDWPEILIGDWPMDVWLDVHDNNKGFAIATKGIYEYSISDDGEIYLTLLRCIGYLSKNGLKTRPTHAGPPIPIPNAQELGEHILYYSLIPHENSWNNAVLHKIAREYHAPLIALEIEKSSGTFPTENSFIEILSNNAIFTSLKSSEDSTGAILRFYTINDSNIRIKFNDLILNSISNMYLSNLVEEEQTLIYSDKEIININSEPWKIFTIKLKKK